MTLPPRFPFKTSLLFEGKELLPIVEEEHKEIVRRLDPYFEKRIEFGQKFLDDILCPFSLFLHKFPVLKIVLNTKKAPKNITLVNLLQDALWQNITDLSEIMSSFLDFLDVCRGKFPVLFRRRACHQLINALIDSSPENEVAFQARKEEIDRKREPVFLKYSQKGNPSDEVFEQLKAKAFSIRVNVKKYRDQVTAHKGSEEIILTWKDLDVAVEQFQELTYDIYTLGSFEMRLGEASGPGFLAAETSEILIKEIFF